MITLLISFVALVAGYFIYGRVVERVFGVDNRVTPAVAHSDGVDYVPLPLWRVFTIQFLNIAGTGPIFGAIMGIWFGPAAFLWIVLGSIFAGAVHDYLTGMLSMRHDGASLPAIVGEQLGTATRRLMLVFSLLLLLILSTVFVYSPAQILSILGGNELWWVAGIFVYYILATLLPIDKVIGRIYPIFAIALIFMAVALVAVLCTKMPAMPELWHMGNMAPWIGSHTSDGHDLLGVAAFKQNNPLFPCMFITIACGAISGFHATQSPLMARCMVNERQGRPVFYGAMITEGVVALIWAAISSYFFYCGGWKEVVSPELVDQFMEQATKPGGKTLIQFFTAPRVVEEVSVGWLGVAGGLLAILGVVLAPITSGDTALRSARLIVSETFKIKQRSAVNRLAVSLPLFVAVFGLLWWQMSSPDGFNTLWQYFGWSNQTLAVFALWTFTVYLARERKCFWLTLVPAIFMTCVCTAFMLFSPMMLNLDARFMMPAATVAAVGSAAWFAAWLHRERSRHSSF